MLGLTFFKKQPKEQKTAVKTSLKYTFPLDFYSRPEDIDKSNHYSVRVYDFGFDINSISTQELNREIQDLLHGYKFILKRILNKDFDFFRVTEIERRIIKTLRIKFSGHSPLNNYLPIDFTATSVRLIPVTGFYSLNFTPENTIKEISLSSIQDVVFFECTFPFDTLKEFALCHEFFSKFSINTPFGIDPLDEILRPLLPQISHIR